jgi:hypothetical protein
MAIGKKTGGRQKGTPNKANAERQERIAASGITRLDAMIADMRFHWDAHQKALAEKNMPEASKELALAREAAKDAAPYCHARLAAVEHTGKGGGPLQTQHLVGDAHAILARRIEALAARFASGEPAPQVPSPRPN